MQASEEAVEEKRGRMPLGHKVRLHLIFTALITIVLYSPMLGVSFDVLDDPATIVNNSLLRSWSNLKTIFVTSYFPDQSFYRPLVSLSHLVEFQVAGLNPVFYHVVNVALHLLAALGVYFLIKEVSGRTTHAALATFLFSVHPIQWEAVAHIAGRSNLLSAAGFIWSMYFFCRWLRLPRFSTYAASLFGCALAFLSKESTATLPLVAVAAIGLIRSQQKQQSVPSISLRKTGLALSGFFMVLFVYIAWRIHLDIHNVAFWTSPVDLVKGVLTFLQGMWIYLRVLVWPVDIHFDRALAYVSTWKDPAALGAAAAWIIAAVIIFWRSRRWTPATKFWLAWVTITVLPVSQIVPLRVHFSHASLAEHFMYLPSVGLMPLLLTLIENIWVAVHKRWNVPASAMALIFIGLTSCYVLVTVKQNRLMTQPYAIYEQTLSYTPQNVRVRSAYALGFALEGRTMQAEDQFRRVLTVEPGNITARFNYGRTLLEQRRYKEALREFEYLRKLNLDEPWVKIIEENIRLTRKAYPPAMTIKPSRP